MVYMVHGKSQRSRPRGLNMLYVRIHGRYLPVHAVVYIDHLIVQRIHPQSSKGAAAWIAATIIRTRRSFALQIQTIVTAYFTSE